MSASPESLLKCSPACEGDGFSDGHDVPAVMPNSGRVPIRIPPHPPVAWDPCPRSTDLPPLGSTALQFFERVEYPESDLDLYVEHSHVRPVAEWLVQNRQIQSRRETTLEQELDPEARVYCSGRGVHNVYNFYKHHPERKIQIMASINAPLEVVLNFHSTYVMNIITYEKAYSLYPKATFVERRSLMYSTDGVNQEVAREKYVSRGWPMVERLVEDDFLKHGASFYPGFRYMGDSRCWTIPLYPSVDLPKGFVETNSWALRLNNHSTDGLFTPTIKSLHLWAANLEFSYIIDQIGVVEDLTEVLGTLKSTEQDYDADVLQHVRDLCTNLCFRFGNRDGPRSKRRRGLAM